MSDSPESRPRPVGWHEFNPRPLHPYLLPFYYINWGGEWIAYILGKWTIFEILDYIGSLSILVAVIFYFADAGDRLKQKHYQAWQVINTAQGKGGSGGRIDALQELNEDRVPLVGVDLSDAFLQQVQLIDADLRRSNFHGTDLKGAVLNRSNMEEAQFLEANLRNSQCESTNLTDANFADTDLNGADLSGANLQGVHLDRADLRGVNFGGVQNWLAIGSITGADIHGIQNAPANFCDWATKHGAVDIADDDAWNRQLEGSATTREATK